MMAQKALPQRPRLAQVNFYFSRNFNGRKICCWAMPSALSMAPSGFGILHMLKSCPLPQKSRPASLLRRIPRGIGGFPQVSCSSVCSFQMSPHPLPSASLPQSRWNTFCRSMLTGLLSGLVSMMSAMKSHHLRLMAVSAPLAQSASSSISM